MEELKELVRVISKHKVKQIEVIGNSSVNGDKDSKFQSLYSLVHDGEVNTDQDALDLLYGDSPKSQQSYTKLKNRLKTRLLNTLFLIDVNQPQFTDIQQAFFTCNKNWMATRMLLSRGARKSALNLAERTLRIAQHYEFTELIIYLAKELRFHYSLVDANKIKYSLYDELVSKQSKIFEAELQAEKFYTDVMKEFGSSQQAISDQLVRKAANYSDQLLRQYSNVQSFRFIRISYLLHIIRHQINFDFEKAIVSCQNAIEFIQSKPYESQVAIFGFNLRLLSCYVQLMRFEEGEHLATHYSNALPPGSYNWFVIQFYYFLLSSHSRRYNQCYDILQSVVTHKNFDAFYENHKQLWYVNEAFVHFLIYSGQIDPTKSTFPEPRKFRLYKFLNEIPIYSKDKRGINISILIVHVLLLLQKRNFSKIIDRVDALNQYCHRYLRKDDTFRANCFIKMLLQMPKANFNRIRTERYAAKYREKLALVPLNVASQGVEVEIVPYEDLWEIVLDMLD